MAAVEEMADVVKGLLDRVETERLKRNTKAGTNLISSAAGSHDTNVYDLTCRRRLLGHLGKVYAHHWSGADDRLVSASQDSKLIDWNAMTEGKFHLVQLTNGWVMTCGFDQATPPRFVASGGLDNGCTVYDVSGDTCIVKDPAAVMTGHDGYTSCVRFIKDSGTIVSSSGDTTCIVWDVRTESQIVRLHDHAADVMGVSIKPGSSTEFVSGATDMKAILWDTRLDSPAAVFVGHEGDINAVDFMPNGMAFATASDDHTIRVFDIRSHGCVSAFSATQAATSVACSKSGRLVVAGFEDAVARGWKTVGETDAPVFELRHEERTDIPDADASHRISSVGFNASGSALCTGSWDHSLSIWAQA